MQPGRRRQPSMGLMLLFYQIFAVIGVDKIPPVTLGSIGLQVAIFLRLFKLPWHKASHVCVSVYRVWRKREFFRLLYGAVEHVDDWHLYYNMVSFAWKGISLERRLGSVKFAYLLTVFSVLTNIVLVALNAVSSKYFGNYEDQCAVGFSGVIFALKVLTTYYNNNYTQQIMGIPIILPGKYAVWAELFLIQLFVPNASFYGHLAGILVGLAYVNGPLKFIMDLIFDLATGAALSTNSRPRFEPQSGPSGYARTRSSQNFSQSQFSFQSDYAQPSPPTYDSYVPPGMTEEEQVRRAMEESMNDQARNSAGRTPPPPPPPGFIFESDSFNRNPSQPPQPGFSPNIEDLRYRRQEHFGVS